MAKSLIYSLSSPQDITQSFSDIQRSTTYSYNCFTYNPDLVQKQLTFFGKMAFSQVKIMYISFSHLPINWKILECKSLGSYSHNILHVSLSQFFLLLTLFCPPQKSTVQSKRASFGGFLYKCFLVNNIQLHLKYRSQKFIQIEGQYILSRIQCFHES